MTLFFKFISLRLRVFLVVLSGLVALPAASADDAYPVPPPDLASLDAQGRQLLRQAMDYFDSQRDGLSGRELGLAFGRLGLHFLAQGQAESAIAALRHARDLDASNYRWPYFLGLTQSTTGNAAGASALFGEALGLKAGDPVIATRLGLALIDAGKPDSALSMLEAVVEDPENRTAAAIAGLGRLAIERGDFDVAVRRYDIALKLDPRATRLYGALASAHRALGNDAQADEALAKQGDGLPMFEDPLVALLDAHRQPSSHFVSLGDRARDAGRVGQAAVFYDFAVAINPQDTLATARLAALRAPPPAQTAPDLAALPDPSTASEFFERGVFLAARGEDDKAVADFEAALEREPDNVAARVFLANALMRARRFSEAAVQYGTASARDDKNAELRYRQGIAWLAANRCDRAETALLAGYDLDQTALRIVQAIARLYATCQVDENKRADALRYAQALYNGAPSLETSATLAMVLAANGRFEDAADYQRQAIFEALKTGRTDESGTLSANLERYVAGKSCEQAWPLDHAIFRPAPPTAGPTG